LDRRFFSSIFLNFALAANCLVVNNNVIIFEFPINGTDDDPFNLNGTSLIITNNNNLADYYYDDYYDDNYDAYYYDDYYYYYYDDSYYANRNNRINRNNNDDSKLQNARMRLDADSGLLNVLKGVRI
jgi:hypothetical protein